MKEYIVPKLTVIGSAAAVTQAFNKVGGSADQYSSLVPDLIGSTIIIT